MRMPSSAFWATSAALSSSCEASGRSRCARRCSSQRRCGSRSVARCASRSSIRADDLGLGQLHLALPHGAVAADVAVLADAGRVVHQAGHPHPRMVGHRVERLRHVQRRQLAAEVQEMLRLQQPGHRPARRGRDAVEEGLDPRPASKPRSPRQSASSTVVTPAAAHCASCASMRRTARPAGIGARQHLAFEVVGMHVDHAGDQVVAVQVHRAGADGCGRAGPRRCGRRAARSCPRAPPPAAPAGRW